MLWVISYVSPDAIHYVYNSFRCVHFAIKILYRVAITRLEYLSILYYEE